MKMSKRQLNEVINSYLLNEADFGSFQGGVEFEFCDLSKLPKIFTAIFEPIRERDTKKLHSAISEEKIKALRSGSSQNSRRIKTLNKRLEELEGSDWTASDAFAGIFRSSTFMGLTKLLGPGLTIMTMLTKVDCDHIVNLVNIFTINVLAPLLGIEGAQLLALEDEIKGHNEEREDAQGTEESSEFNPNNIDVQRQIFQNISDVYKDNNILNYEKRNDSRKSGRLKLHEYDGKITDVHLDFFELFSPNEYFKFLEDPEETIADSAKDNFINAIDLLEKRGHRDFDSFINSFVLATPGTNTDAAVSKVLKAANLRKYFNEPKDAIIFVKNIFKIIYKEFDFEGIQILGL